MIDKLTMPPSTFFITSNNQYQVYFYFRLMRVFRLAQNGTSREDYLNGVAIAQDGSIVVEGGTNGSYHRENEGGLDFVAMKLDSNGSVQWAWQVRLNTNWFSFPYYCFSLFVSFKYITTVIFIGSIYTAV